MLCTRGMGGPQQLLCTAGHGSYSVVIIEPEPETPDNIGGTKKQFQVMHKRIWLRKKKEPAKLQIEDVFPEEFILEIEGEEYGLIEGKPPTVKEAIAEFPIKEFEEKIERAMKELGVAKSKARKAMEKRVAKEIRALKDLQKELAADDEDFFVLLMLSEL